jgi:copper transport protein
VCVRAVSVVLLILLAVLGTGAAPAAAHASLDSTDPAQGSELATAPARVDLTFSEGVGLSARALVVLDPSGRRVDRGNPHHPGGNTAVVSVDLTSGLPRASYAVVWRVESADGHPVSGTFSFGVAVPAGTAPTDAGSDPSVSAAALLARIVGYAGVVLLLGGMFFVLVLWPAGSRVCHVRRLLIAAWTASVLATIGLLIVQGPLAEGLGPTRVFDPELLGATVGSRYGQLLVLRLCVLGLAVPLLRRVGEVAQERTRWEPAGFAALLLVSYAFAGHAGQGSWSPLAATADAVHFACASVWLGGLAVLVLGLLPTVRAPRAAVAVIGELLPVLPRWSRTAMVAVAGLVVTGVYQAWRQVGALAALPGTDYGRLVLAKAVALVVLLVLGDAGRRWVGRHLTPGETRSGIPDGRAVAAGSLWLSVVGEVAVGAVVVVLTSMLVSAVPARIAYAPPFRTTVTATGNDGGRISVVFDVSPTRVGPQTVHLYTYSTAGAVLPVQTVVATLVEQQQHLGPIRFTFAPTGTGHATAEAIPVPAAGTWTLTAQIHTDATTDYAATATYTVH